MCSFDVGRFPLPDVKDDLMLLRDKKGNPITIGEYPLEYRIVDVSGKKWKITNYGDMFEMKELEGHDL